jgi:cytochrome b6-f complex iron-sulfur subunit
MKPGELQSRRGFLDWLIGLGGAISGAALAIPGLAYLWPAAKGGTAERVEVPGAADLAPGTSASVQVGSKAVILVRSRSGYRAFSAVCSHLGCLVKWDSAGKVFRCPCHAAVFDADGKVVSGPPPAPLVEYAVKEIEDRVYVSAPA